MSLLRTNIGDDYLDDEFIRGTKIKVTTIYVNGRLMCNHHDKCVQDVRERNVPL